MLFLMALVTTTLSAQRNITGTINGTDGPIIGASVIVKGTTNGTVTDENGNFSLTTKESNPTLVVSALGYTAQELVPDNQSAYNLTMKEDISQLNEVVVSGYYNETKKTSTGSVATVKTKDLVAVPSGNVEQQLQGKVSGVTVITNGQPGTSSIVRIHGFGSLAGNQPLYVVDGVPTQDVSFLNPDDIETTTVLKDAAAASIYGSRAAPGVIVFTTKIAKKTERKLNVTYDAVYGVTNPGSGQAILNPQDQANWTWTALRNSGNVGANGNPSSVQYGNGATPVLPDYILVGNQYGVIGNVDLAAAKLKYNTNQNAGSIYQVTQANKAGTDWYAAITRNAPLLRQTLGFSGAGDNYRFYIGLAAQQQQGILLNNNFSRYLLRANTEFNVFKGFRIGENLQFTYQSVLGLTGGGNGANSAQEENDVQQAFRMSPIIPVYDVFGGYAGTAAKEFNNARNPVASRDYVKNNQNYSVNGFGNIYAELDILPGLTARTSIGGKYGNYNYKNFGRIQYENSENNTSFGFGTGSGQRLDWILTNTLSYKMTFDKHALEVLAGQETLNLGQGSQVDASVSDPAPFSTDPNYVTLSTITSNKVLGSQLYTPVSIASLFGRVNYGFADKYYLTAVVRRDGSSVFAPVNRYGVFPAFSAAWRVTGEDFLKNSSWLSDLKIRGGWGRMGNSNNVFPTNQFSLYQSSPSNAGYDINGSKTSAATGFYRSSIGNPDAKWETATTTSLGFDASLFKNKLDISFEVWKKETSDMLYNVPISDVTGSYANSPAVNIASMQNQGIDLQIINRGNVTHDLKYELTLNGSFLDNKITSLAPGITYFDQTPGTNRQSANQIRDQVGLPLSSFFGYKVQGIFQNQAEVDAAPAQDGKGVGRFRYVDVNGDGKITSADRTNLGSPIPTFTGGLNIKLIYNDFSLETYIYTSQGNKIFNLNKWNTDFYPSFPGSAISARVATDSWSPSNPGGQTPVFENASNASTNQQPNSWFVEDGTYFRMQFLTLSYNFPQKLIKGVLKKARIYASANNIFTISKYKGLDPQVGGAADTNFGIDVGNYPVTRSYTFGVSVGF